MSALGSPLEFGLGIGGEFRGWATEPPTSDPWLQGDILLNAAPEAGGDIGWVCVESGVPGTWLPWGAIASS